MCGIVGIINQDAAFGNYKARNNLCKAFDDMLWADMLRGMDGTGIMQYTSKGTIDTLKCGGNPIDLSSVKGYSALVNWSDVAFATIGHNRSSTRGKSNDANAHPFTEEHITLVHNGTLTYFPKEYGHQDPDHNVDSKALTKMIADMGFLKAVDEFAGAYACVWFDSKEKTINFARNFERPLARVSFAEGLAIASEIYLPAWCLSRNGIEPKKLEIVPTNTLFSISIDKMTDIIETPYTPRPKTTHQMGYTGAYWDQVDNYSDPEKWRTPKSKGSKSEKKSDAKEKIKIRGTGKTLNDEYAVGDEILLKLNYYKINHNSSFMTVKGNINEPIAENLNHLVVGNFAGDTKLVENFDQLYTARISAIGMTANDFHIINVRDITPCVNIITKEIETPKVIALPVLPAKQSELKLEDLCACDACKVLFEKKELRQRHQVKRYAAGGGTVNTITICESCEVSIDLDPSLFELAAKSVGKYPIYMRELPKEFTGLENVA